jgi:hypothetical protein
MTSPESELAPRELDDQAQREELRQRFYGLLQELRVVLPGVQVLLAFMLTAPFTNRFHRLDAVGRNTFTAALTIALVSAVCLIAPTVFHRMGDRTARGVRLEWSVRLTLVGMWLLGAALVLSAWCVVRFLYGTAEATAIVGVPAVVLLGTWLVLPLVASRR